MTPDNNAADRNETLDAQNSIRELEQRLEESQRTIDSLEKQLIGISEALAGVMEIAKNAFPEAYEEYMKNKLGTDEENT